jgi:hypothetical protein
MPSLYDHAAHVAECGEEQFDLDHAAEVARELLISKALSERRGSVRPPARPMHSTSRHRFLSRCGTGHGVASTACRK